jgi:hypothetical protein
LPTMPNHLAWMLQLESWFARSNCSHLNPISTICAG